jgi:hypothetical protein
MLGDKYKTKVISINKVGNKIRDKRVFVPYGQHLVFGRVGVFPLKGGRKRR